MGCGARKRSCRALPIGLSSGRLHRLQRLVEFERGIRLRQSDEPGGKDQRLIGADRMVGWEKGDPVSITANGNAEGVGGVDFGIH